MNLKKICEKCGKSLPLGETGNLCADCSAADKIPVVGIDDTNELAVGTELHGYRILQKLGNGGMGTVYLAEQKSMQRQIALKILNSSVTKDAAAVEQFLNEVRNTGQIHHPNIVNAFDAGCENGTYFLAMQYINGDTLDHILQNSGALEEIRALEIAAQISGALAYVWNKHQLFHRDIKPGNIMIDSDENKAMLMDLGIAQKLGDVNGESESVEGSPYYMSPEQIQGHTLSWTTDLYSLGATLYQLIVGVPPYDDTTIEEILKKHCQAEFPEPSERNPESNISPETVALLKKMMAKSPEQRFATWGDFIRELNTVIAQLKEFAADPGKRLKMDAVAMAQAKRDAMKKKKKTASMVTLLIILLIAGGGVFGYRYLTGKNAAEAREYLGGDKKDAVSKLSEAFEKYRKNPTKNALEDFLKETKNAERIAKAAGVHPDDAKDLLDEVERTRQQAQQLNFEYDDFNEFVKKFERDNKMIGEKLNSFNVIQGTSDEPIAIKNMIDNLENSVKKQRTSHPAQMEQKRKFGASIAAMRKTLAVKQEKMQAYLAKQEEEKRRRVQAAAKAREEALRDSISYDSSFSEAEQAGKDEVAKKIQAEQERIKKEKKAAEDRIAAEQNRFKKQEAERRAKEAAERNRVVLVGGSDAVPEIEKEQKKIKNEFFKAFAKADMDAACNIRFREELLSLRQTPQVKAALDNLKREHEKYHKIAVAAKVGKDALFDLNNLRYFRGLQVRTTDLNRGLGKTYLKVDKLVNGSVHFSNPGSSPENFLNLSMYDKEKLAERIVIVKRLDKSIALPFYFSMGLYRLAIDLCLDHERKFYEEEAKELIKFQYNEAKKKNDIRLLNRLRRDYKDLKIMKGIIR